MAAELLTLSRIGLRNRCRKDQLGQDESVYLAPLQDAVARGKTCADELLDRYNGRWGGNIDLLFKEFSF